MIKRKLTENIRRVEERIQRACARVGRSPTQVKLVAVTKTVGLDVIRTLIEMGTEDLGESRVQELVRRASMISEWQRRRGFEKTAPPAGPRWHLVGHLQRNKVKLVLPWTHLIHSVDSLRLAEEIDAQSRKLATVTPILLQVNAANEPQKSGVVVAAATHLAEQLRTLPNLRLCGLMAMGPLTTDEKLIRHAFARTRELFDEIVHERIGGPEFTELSLGMSQDFEYAIEVGATLVRIGSALFEGIEQTIEPPLRSRSERGQSLATAPGGHGCPPRGPHAAQQGPPRCRTDLPEMQRFLEVLHRPAQSLLQRRLGLPAQARARPSGVRAPAHGVIMRSGRRSTSSDRPSTAPMLPTRSFIERSSVLPRLTGSQASFASYSISASRPVIRSST